MGLVAMKTLFLCEFYFSKLSHILLLHVFRDSGKIDGSVISCQIQHQTVIRYEVMSNQLYLCKFRPGPIFFCYVKFMFSKKATKFDKIFTSNLTLCSKCQIDGEDFVNFCGLLGKYELYHYKRKAKSLLF